MDTGDNIKKNALAKNDENPGLKMEVLWRPRRRKTKLLKYIGFYCNNLQHKTRSCAKP